MDLTVAFTSGYSKKPEEELLKTQIQILRQIQSTQKLLKMNAKNKVHTNIFDLITVLYFDIVSYEKKCCSNATFKYHFQNKLYALHTYCTSQMNIWHIVWIHYLN